MGRGYIQVSLYRGVYKHRRCFLSPTLIISNKEVPMTDDRYRPRLSVDLDSDLHKKLQDLVPWGIRSQLIIALLEGAIEMIEKHGDIVTALIIRKKLQVKDVLKLDTKEGDNSG
jgi:hypothetical protein